MKKIISSLLFLLIVVNLKAQNIFINEFMASNDNIYSDEYGDFDDWIEIYNSTQNSIDIGGWYITDNFLVPDLWQIPDSEPIITTILPNSFIIIWADNEVEQGVLHVNIKLSSTGEQIALVKQIGDDFIFIDSITYPEQFVNISYGRYPDSSEEWMNFDIPTPGYSNFIASNIRSFDKLFVSIFPNPNNGIFNVKCENSNKLSFDFFDLNGRLIDYSTVNITSHVFYYPQLRGIYVLKLYNKEQNSVIVKKIIIN